MQYQQQPGPYLAAPAVVQDPTGHYGVAMPPGYIGLPGYGMMPGYMQPEHAAYGADAATALAHGMEHNLTLRNAPQQQIMGLGRQQYAAPQQGYPPAAYQQPEPGYPAPSRTPPGMHRQQPGPPVSMGVVGVPGPPNGMMGGPPGVQRQQAPNTLPNHLHPQHSPDGHHPNSHYAAGPQEQGPRGPRMGRMGGDFRQGGPLQQNGSRSGRKVPRGLEDNVKRTVYISQVDQQVTEESLATFFADCGTVMDCRICGDPNSAMRFAFIEFMEIQGAQQALHKTGQKLNGSQLRVLPSKTAIVPVNKELMPRSHEELERCSRTVYVANIDKALEKEDVRGFFEELCGPIGKIRLLGDLAHSTRIAFIEFIQAESAMAALNCSGALLGSLPLRVSPSKTPVRGDKEDRDALRQQQRRRQRQRQQQEGSEQQQQQQQQDGGIVDEGPQQQQQEVAADGEEDAAAAGEIDADVNFSAEAEAAAVPRSPRGNGSDASDLADSASAESQHVDPAAAAAAGVAAAPDPAVAPDGDQTAAVQ